jgi:hypothetical protein
MIPTLIEDLIQKLLDNKVHREKRQFYYTTLLNIKNATEAALEKYNKRKEDR